MSDDERDAPDSDEEMDWEEVPIDRTPQHLEISLGGPAKVEQVKAKTSQAERLWRIACHKFHTVCLLANARVRNGWLNNELLHARLMSLTPMPLQLEFSVIHKSRYPEAAKRGRLFEAALRHLVEWWAGEFFFDLVPEGHIRNRSFESVQSRLDLPEFRHKVLDADLLEDLLDEEVELIRSPNSLMKHALMQSGSRDTSAQLFTALCRGLGLPARLVVSLQSVPWKVGVDKPKTPSSKDKVKGKGRADQDVVEYGPEFPGEGARLDGLTVKAKGKEKSKPTIKLRKTQSKGKVLGRKPRPKEDPLTSPPVFWTEVFSRPDGRWIPVDPLRAIVNNRKCFHPPSSSTQNRMVYVLAFEEDGYARDVTRKYARHYTTKVSKLQGGGRARAMWWDSVVATVARPYRLMRDDVEDEEMNSIERREGMPTTMSGFKNHPMYVLARDLHKNETLYPPPPDTPELGTFRGEPVYPRSSVITLKTPDTWMRTEGRVVKTGAQPLKFVKMRASTVNRRREVEMLKEAGRNANEEDVMQGLYGRMQTELYVAPPIANGVIPRNDFGNIDLYTPSMLPQGAVHIPYKGVAKIAKKLGISYAEAVTRFDFKKRKAVPVMEGVVVAKENEQLLLDAYWESEQDAQEKAKLKQMDKAIKQWSRLIHGLRIRQRLQEQYGPGSDRALERTTLIKAKAREDDEKADVAVDSFQGAGGFMVGADDVVSKYRLPKSVHVQEEAAVGGPGPSTLLSRLRREQDLPERDQETVFEEEQELELHETMDIENAEPLAVLSKVDGPAPKSMAELAEEMGDDLCEAPPPSGDEEDEEWDDHVSTPVPKPRLATLKLRDEDKNNNKKTSPGKTPVRKVSSKRKRGQQASDEETPDEGEVEIPAPKKTRRKTPAPVVASTRTLRPRKSKTFAFYDGDKEDEEY